MTESPLQNKLRWQSRRGTLELDLLLQKYWRKTPSPCGDELNALAELLALDDEDLTRVIKDGEGGGDGDGLSQAARMLAKTLGEL